ncbi:MAG: hypothetical protein ACPGJI_09515, partial [Kangiellaceae bacterium]
MPDPKFQRLQKTQQQLADQYNKVLKRLIDRYEKGIGTHGQLNNNIQRLNSKYNIAAETQDRVTSEVNKNIGVIGKLNQARRRYTNAISNANKSFGGTAAGKAFASSGGQMALMMGLPMAGGFLKDSIGGAAGAGIGGAMTGAATGASLGMMFGPLGTAIGAAAGGLYGFVNGLNEAEEAAREKAKAEREAFVSQRSANVQQGLSQAIGQIAKQEIPNIFTAKNLAEFKSGTEARHYAGTNGMGASEYEGMQLLQRLQASDFFTQFGEHSGGKISMLDILKPGAISQFSTGGKEGLREKDAKQIAEAYAQQMALMQGIKGLPAETKIQSGQDRLSKTEFLDKIASYDFGDPEDLKKFQEDVKNARNTFQASADADTERLKGVILQLNLQKIMIDAQKKAREAQFNITSSMEDQASTISLMEKGMGGFITEQQKAQFNLIKSINKAAQTYASSAQQAEDTFESGMLGILKDEDTQAKVKTALAKQIGYKGDETKLDLTQEFSKLSQSERENLYEQLDLSDEIKLSIENQLLTRKNALNLAEKEVNAANNRAQTEFKINDAIAKRKDLISDMKTSAGIGAETVGSAGRIRAMDAQVAAAERLGALGPGYQTSADQEAFQMEEKRIALQNKSLEIQDQSNQKMNDELIKLADLKMQDAELIKLKEKGINLSPQEHANLLALEATSEKRKQQQNEIVGSVERINKEAKKEISTAEKLLALEEKRLKAKRAHETGPGAFGNGMTDAFKSMRDQVATMDYELGQRIPFAFADGMANAMTEALNGTKNIKDALTDAAISFLGMIQQAMMQKMAYQMVGAMGFSRGGNVRNYSRGGGVPAMVSNGEYVMSREAVNKYGGSFMHGMNAGGRIPGFAGGGS